MEFIEYVIGLQICICELYNAHHPNNSLWPIAYMYLSSKLPWIFPEIAIFLIVYLRNQTLISV